MDYKYKIGFIGAGNMAKAILNGLLKSNLISKENVILSNTHINGLFNDVYYTTSNKEVIDNSEYLILAIKPQIFKNIANDFDDKKHKCVISIMAGIKLDLLNTYFKSSSVVRVMPNTPSSIGYGMSCITNNLTNIETKNFVEEIFKSIGDVLFVDESLFDAVTSISGSGPAYVYYFIKSMIDAGVEGGLSYEDSKKLTLKTFIGASKMVENSSEDISILIDRVCSKGGTTIQAIDTFKDNKLDQIISNGIKKCRERSKELSKS